MGSSFAGWRLVFPNFDALTRGKILELLTVDGWRLTVIKWKFSARVSENNNFCIN